MKIKQVINLHKGLTAFVILGLMVWCSNFTIGPIVYLALHGTYGFLWLLKDRIYPDKQWEQELTLGMAVFTFVMLGLYWVAPFLLITSNAQPPLGLIGVAIAINITGVFLHYASDAQKYYTLKYKSGLITEGFFARCRNTNYLGEILIYLSFALVAMHWQPYIILTFFFLGIFVPNMRKKDQSLSRYQEFAEYQANSGLLFPRFGASDPTTTTQPE